MGVFSNIVVLELVNPRRACAARVTVVVLCVCVCVFVCPIEMLRMAALSIELSHVLFIKSNYLQNGCVVCRKTLSFLRYSQSCCYVRFRLHGHAYKIMTTPILLVLCSLWLSRVSVVFCHHAHLDPEI